MIETKIIIKQYLRRLEYVYERLAEELPDNLKRGNILKKPCFAHPLLTHLRQLILSVESDLEEYDKKDK